MKTISLARCSSILLVALALAPVFAWAENTIPEIFRQAEQGDAQSVKALQIRAQAGEVAAQRALAMLYLKAEGVPLDYGQAIAWFGKAADQGDALSDFYLATIYHSARGVPADPARAADFYRKAAEKGMTEAQVRLARQYAEGDGVPQNFVEAAKWYSRAAEQGQDADAAFALGQQYAAGQGVARNYPQACQWFSEAAGLGHAEAELNAANCYASGVGEVRDYAQAAGWYQKAADSGVIEASARLADLYAQGQGVAQDADKAQALYQTVAAQEPDALLVLSNAYLGDGVIPPDYVDATVWAAVAKSHASAGSASRQDAEQDLAELTTHLSDQERSAANERTAKILHSNLAGSDAMSSSGSFAPPAPTPSQP